MKIRDVGTTYPGSRRPRGGTSDTGGALSPRAWRVPHAFGSDVRASTAVIKTEYVGHMPLPAPAPAGELAALRGKVSALEEQMRGLRALEERVQASERALLEAFVLVYSNRLAGIAAIEQIVWHVEADGELNLLTVIDHPERTNEDAIFEAEGELLDAFPRVRVDFRLYYRAGRAAPPTLSGWTRAL